ncbi:anthranilate 1,2-dioxygenase regulatory protein AndR [Paraburkholderia sp. D1E]|uniref:anthranilate 1,2-dioxygenase regulatory protein AndR n=1 Tax=Paraburkholderia sp. D1E TaxID=3461398 RepID=UPI004045EE7B
MRQPDFHPFALRNHRLFESTDVDETRELISRVMQPHSLVPSGSGHGRSHMDFVKIGRLGIGTISFGGPMRVDVKEVSGYYLMMFCVSGEAEVSAGGRTVRVNSEQAILRAPGEPFSAILSSDCEQLVMRIDPAAFRSEDRARHRRVDPFVSLSGELMRAWKEQLQLVAGSPEFLNCACAHPSVAAHVEALLVNLLTAAHCAKPMHSSARAPVPHIVRVADEFMAQHLPMPLMLQDIASAAGVSIRTLGDAFQNFRNASPMTCLRQLRLDRARAALVASSGAVSIATIAMDCGFTHLGRFAISYRERFGESPSDTVRRR